MMENIFESERGEFIFEPENGKYIETMNGEFFCTREWKLYLNQNGEYIWTRKLRKCLNQRIVNILEPENGEYI